MQYLKFKCGCQWPLKKDNGPLFPLLKLSYDDVKARMETCPAVWDLFAKGLTNGVFQLDSNIGKRYCKDLKPETIDHLGALTAILRPGTSMSKDENGKSLTSKFCDRKNGREEVTYQFPALKHILAESYDIMIYQEQQIKIATDICAFTLSQADDLRKGVGKKDAKKLFALEEQFVSGAEKVGKVSRDDAIKIFGWIKNAARYSFNKSHSTLYGIKACVEAYLKTHAPLHFITSKLKSPRNSFTAVDRADMIYEAKTHFGIETKLPDLRDCQETFYNDGKDIYFGLTSIKGYGTSAYLKLKEVFPVFKGFKTEQVWFDFAINATRYLTESNTCLMIETGALDWMNMTRTEMLEEFKLVSGMTDTEKKLLFQHYDATEAGVVL